MQPQSFNPDFRRVPKTKYFCACCYKDIKDVEKAVKVTVHWGDWTFVESWDMQNCFPDPLNKEIGNELFGRTCIKKKGF